MKVIKDIIITFVLWIYFLTAYIILLPYVVYLLLFSSDREASFQYINHLFFKGFFALVNYIIPNVNFVIPEEVRSIKSSIVICNHLSYLDPIWLVSIFKKQKTVVKGSFLKVPIMGWILKMAGYLPTTAGGSISTLMIKRLKDLKEYLEKGGIIFIFPEGTRSRNGQIGKFIKGGFSIAKQCGAPIELLLIKNTNKLFTPGKFLFNTSTPITIEIERLSRIEPDYENEFILTKKIMDMSHDVYVKKLNENK